MSRNPIVLGAAAALVISTSMVFGGCADGSLSTPASPTPQLDGTIVAADTGEIADRGFALIKVLEDVSLTPAEFGDKYLVIEARSTLAGDAIAAAADETSRAKLVDQGFLAERLARFRDPAGDEVQLVVKAFLAADGAAAAMADARAQTAVASERFTTGPLLSVEARLVEVPLVGDESHGVDTHVRQKASADSEFVFEVYYSAFVARRAAFTVSIATTPPMEYAALATLAETLFSRLPNELPQ